MQSSILEILKKSLKTNQIWQCTSENLNLYKLEKKHFKSMKKMITATKMQVQEIYDKNVKALFKLYSPDIKKNRTNFVDLLFLCMH